MSNEYKFYFSMKNIMVPQAAKNSLTPKDIEYQFIKTSAFHLNLDLPKKYQNSSDLTVTKSN
jgi:hypothetical protein